MQAHSDTPGASLCINRMLNRTHHMAMHFRSDVLLSMSKRVDLPAYLWTIE